ncbi:MAG: CbiX/SirB N-terminal domain-containing protein [Hyphomicrobiales bacterium]
MSGTRSHFPPARATDRCRGLLIVAHGECRGAGTNVLARELARRLLVSGAYEEVEIGYARATPSIEEAASRLSCREVSVYPLFMSDGYYVRNMIPERLRLSNGQDAFGHTVTIAKPLGLSRGLPGVIARGLQCASDSLGLKPQHVHVLFVAHGSTKSSNSADVARELLERVRRRSTFASFGLALLEGEPSLAVALRAAPRPLLVLGLFTGEGLHGGEDLHGAVQALHDPHVHVVDQLGGYAGVIELIVHSSPWPQMAV